MLRGAIFLTVAALTMVGAGYAWIGDDMGAADGQEPPLQAPQSEMPLANVTSLPTLTPMPKTRGLGNITAQSYSNKCRVPDGSICYVQAQPVGSSCTCPGNQTGIVVW